MQDQTNEEPPLTSTAGSPVESAGQDGRAATNGKGSPFLGCAAERLVADHFMRSDRVRRGWGERPYYRVKGVDARVSLAAVAAQHFVDHRSTSPTVLAAKMAMGRVSMTRQERLAFDFLIRKKELLHTVLKIHELMPEIEAAAAHTWMVATAPGDSQ